MNLRDFFDHEDISLPIRWGDNEDFGELVEGRFDAFLGHVQELKKGKVRTLATRNLSRIEKCCRGLGKAIRRALDGRLPQAYDDFCEAMSPISSTLDRHAKRRVTIDSIDKPFGPLFRLRITDTPVISREDIFHIPFDKRYRVTPQRYSISGLPCLYLAGSIYTCWEELGRPPFHKIQAAAIWVTPGHSLNCIDFAYRPELLARVIMPDGSIHKGTYEILEVPSASSPEAYLCSRIVLWPLLASCSVVVKHRDEPYKPEYVVPQLLLQWIANRPKWDGIAFFSTHVRPVAQGQPLALCNFVFPTQTPAYSPETFG